MAEEEGYSTLRKVYSWWNWIWNDPIRSDPSRLPVVPPSGPPLVPPANAEGIFTDEFYAQIAARVPLKFAALSRYIGSPVLPVLDLLALSGGNVINSMDIANASRVYNGHIVQSDFPPLGAAAAAGTVATVSLFNDSDDNQFVYPIFLSQIATAANWAWRRYNTPLATGLRLNVGIKRILDGAADAPEVRITSADIASASFPPLGASEVICIHTSGQFGAPSPTLQALGWLGPKKGMIVYSADVFGAPIVAAQRPGGIFTLWIV